MNIDNIKNIKYNYNLCIIFLESFLQREFQRMSKKKSFTTSSGYFFESPDLAAKILSDVCRLDISRISLQPSCIVQDDACVEHRENGITYVAYDKNGWHYARRRVSAQGMLARMFFDPFGRRRVEKAIKEIKAYYRDKPVIIEVMERL